MKFAKVLLIALSLLTLVACASNSDENTANEFIVTYDGTEYSYNGPTTVKSGDISFFLTNPTDTDIDIRVFRINEENDWDELVNYLLLIDPTPLVLHLPDWTSNAGIIVSNEPGNPESWTFTLKTGSYAVLGLKQRASSEWEITPLAPLEVQD